jgi:hypothetical protein
MRTLVRCVCLGLGSRDAKGSLSVLHAAGLGQPVLDLSTYLSALENRKNGTVCVWCRCESCCILFFLMVPVVHHPTVCDVTTAWWQGWG